MERRKRCYTYTRVSTAMQVDGYSLDAQQDRLNKYAEFQKMDIIREYCDAGKSGKSISGRPEFQQMLQDVAQERDCVDYILVFKLSRFGRNAADVLNSLQSIQDYGVNLICVEDGIDSSKDSGKLTITVLSAVAEIERENILVQTMEGRKQKAREGLWNGGTAPFGYRLNRETGILEIEPEEAEIVRIIFDQFVHKGMGCDGISRYLNRRGYSKGKQREQELNYFSRPLIKNILDNPVYTGKISYGRTKVEKIKGSRDESRRIKSGEYLLAEGRHEAIIDEKLWLEAQDRRKETGMKWVKTHSLDHEHLLSGLVKCPVCGAGLNGMIKRWKNKKSGEYRDAFYYKCQRRKKVDDDHFCDFTRFISEDKLNHEVEEVIFRMVQHEDFRAYILQRMGEKLDTEALEQELIRLRTQLKQSEGARDKLTERMERLSITDPHYDRKYQDMLDRQNNLYDRISEIEDEIADVNTKLREMQNSKFSADKIYRILEGFEKLYYKLADIEKKEFLRDLIKSIDIYPEEQDGGEVGHGGVGAGADTAEGAAETVGRRQG